MTKNKSVFSLNVKWKLFLRRTSLVRQRKMSESTENYKEMLPIPAELNAESQKNIAVEQGSGQAIDLNEQGNIYQKLKVNRFSSTISDRHIECKRMERKICVRIWSSSTTPPKRLYR